MKANDGDAIQVTRPEMIKQYVSSGNTFQQLVAIATTLNDLFNRMAGKLDIMGGLSPQSKTAHQDEMLNQNSSKSILSMQQTTQEFVQRIVKSLCWYWHHDPLRVREALYHPRGVPEVGIVRSVTPEQRRQIPFQAMRIKVDPYSLRSQTPESRVADLDEMVMKIYMPMMQLLQQQGITLDFNAYLKRRAHYKDDPELLDLVTVREPPTPQQPSGGAGGAPEGAGGTPPETTRNYVRQNMPGQTREASDRNMVAAMLNINKGGNPETTRNGAME